MGCIARDALHAQTIARIQFIPSNSSKLNKRHTERSFGKKKSPKCVWNFIFEFDYIGGDVVLIAVWTIFSLINNSFLMSVPHLYPVIFPAELMTR